MKMKQFYNIETNTKKYIIEITNFDIVSLRLDKFDNQLLDECSKSEKISDTLLALETIARRIEEQQEKENESNL